MSHHKLLVTERSDTQVGRSVWAALFQEPAFHRLLDSRILNASVLANGSARIQGSCYVGRAICGDVVIEIREKVPGAVESLLPYAAGSAFRIERSKSPASDIGQLTVLLIQHFLAAVHDYVSRSRQFVYERRSEVGCLIGGQIDMSRSMRLRARGLGHLVAFRRNVISFGTPLNRVILAALIEVERIARVIDVGSEILERARGLSLMFSDCRDVRLLFGDRCAIAREAAAVADSPLPSQQGDVAALASVVLAHEGFQWDATVDSRVPRSWFLNLEWLFERAVRCELQQAVDASNSVYFGSYRSRPVLVERRTVYRARPDLVVARQDGRVIVGDVKYKRWTRRIAAADLYQLLVHTAAFSGDQSFVAFPSDEYQIVQLGKSVTDTQTWLFALDLMNFRQSVAQMARDLGV